MYGDEEELQKQMAGMSLGKIIITVLFTETNLKWQYYVMVQNACKTNRTLAKSAVTHLCLRQKGLQYKYKA